MLSVSSAALTQGVGMAFASETDAKTPSETTHTSNATPETTPEISAEMIPLAGSSVSACAKALSADITGNGSLVEAASYDPVAERAVKADSIIDEALQHLGTPYRYGGTTPAGFDCSGFTGYVFRNVLGVDLPRSAAAQSTDAERISLDEAERGDLLFWSSRGGVYHTGIYLGDGEYIHAAASGCVKIQSMDAFSPSFAGRIF